MDFNVKVADWISSRVYSLSDNKTLGFIINHKFNEFIELEGDSAILWKAFLDGSSESEIKELAKINNFEDELNDFINELCSIGLLVSDSKKSDKILNIQNNNLENADDFQSVIFQTLSKTEFLPSLFLEMTYDCNLKCIHCYNDKHLKEQIKFEDIKPAIDEAYNLGIFLITLSGGECTLNKDFIKIIEYIRKKKLAFSFFTNGQILYDDKDFFNKVISLYPYQIALSLYSMNPEIHDRITGVKGSQKKTLSVIKKLREKNIQVRINCFLTRYNANSCDDMKKFAEENNCNLMFDYKLVSNPSKSNRYVKCTKKQQLNLYHEYKDIFNADSSVVIDDKDLELLEICTAGYKMLLISPNLDIYACPSLKIQLGNCKKVSLENVWRNKDSKLSEIRSLKISDLKCHKYDYCKYCSYCLGVAYSENSYIKRYKDFCEDAKIRMKIAK